MNDHASLRLRGRTYGAAALGVCLLVLVAVLCTVSRSPAAGQRLAWSSGELSLAEVAPPRRTSGAHSFSTGHHTAVADGGLSGAHFVADPRSSTAGDSGMGGAPQAHAADAVEDAVKQAHDALKQQRYSLKDSLDADLPTIVTDCLNFSANPCDNFYEYVCGNWVRDTNIPPDRAEWSRVWDGTQQTVDAQLHSLITNQWPEDSPFRRLTNFYQACMDVEAVNAEDGKPLQPMLDRLEALETLEDLQDVLIETIASGGPMTFHFDISLDFRDKVRSTQFHQSSVKSARRSSQHKHTHIHSIKPPN